MSKEKEHSKKNGEKITWDNSGNPIVPHHPIIPYIVGDGTGPDIWAAARPLWDAAVKKAYDGKKSIIWKEVLAGEKAQEAFGVEHPLPQETLDVISEYGIAIKGPLTTPVGGGIRSLNVALRQMLDLYACVRPVRYFEGVPAPVKHPDRLDVVIFRENTEDVYAGIEWSAKSEGAREILAAVNQKVQSEGGKPLNIDSAVGIKPMSEINTERIVSMSIKHAINEKRNSVTIVHKGNIMKYTEGAFRDWGYQTAREQFSDETITEQELYDKFEGKKPEDKVVIKDRIADAMFQQILLRPEEYDIIVTPNLNGDYLSDAAAAQVGGLGIAPGANIGDRCALFEATHGTAPKYAGLDKVNPSSLILSGVEMLRFMGWTEAAELITSAFKETLKQRIVTYDLARQMEGAKEVRCSEFGNAIQKNL